MAKVITNRIKSLLSMAGKKQIELAAYMGISPQSLQNKFSRGSFSADDLIKIANFTGAELAFITGENKVTLDSSCIRESEPVEK
mgnify:CR=1 FL=1